MLFQQALAILGSSVAPWRDQSGDGRNFGMDGWLRCALQALDVSTDHFGRRHPMLPSVRLEELNFLGGQVHCQCPVGHNDIRFCVSHGEPTPSGGRRKGETRAARRGSPPDLHRARAKRRPDGSVRVLGSSGIRNRRSGQAPRRAWPLGGCRARGWGNPGARARASNHAQRFPKCVLVNAQPPVRPSPQSEDLAAEAQGDLVTLLVFKTNVVFLDFF